MNFMKSFDADDRESLEIRKTFSLINNEFFHYKTFPSDSLKVMRKDFV